MLPIGFRFDTVGGTPWWGQDGRLAIMLNFPEPPREYASIFLEETDKSLPKKIDQRTRYAYFSTIAEGGKSLIKSCKDQHLSRFICYKTLRPEFAQDEVEQQRLIREARVSAMLQHPNTVPTYELGRDLRGNPYFTMKLVHGYTLREVLDYRARYDLTQLMEVVMQIGYALVYAHTHGVAHRDIKPENILVGPYGEVVLLDWGLAKVWGGQSGQSGKPGASVADTAGRQAISVGDINITGKHKAQGSAWYMSPEQINQDPDIDYRTDVFSLGAVLYETLCGKPPAKGQKMHQIIDSVLREVPPPPSEVAPQHVPRLLEQVAMRSLEKDPANRFESMGDMVRALRQDWQSDLI